MAQLIEVEASTPLPSAVRRAAALTLAEHSGGDKYALAGLLEMCGLVESGQDGDLHAVDLDGRLPGTLQLVKIETSSSPSDCAGFTSCAGGAP